MANDLSSTLQQLLEVQKQQKTSYESLERLSQQHREWQTTIERLLDHVGDGNAGPGQTPELINESFGVVSNELFEVERKERKVPTLFNERTSATFNAKPLKKLVSEALKEVGRSTGNGKVFKKPQRFAERIVSAHWFEYVTGLIIFANLITVGIELELALSTPNFEEVLWPQIAERIFLSIYFIELVLRFVAGGLSNFKDLWFWMDLSLVALGVFALVIVPLFGGEDDLGFERLLVFRGLRLLRLVRALRMVSHFKIMWRLVYGLLTCGQTILSTMALIMISLFVFACVAIELIARDDDLRDPQENMVVAEIVENNFSSLGRTIMTLMQFVTLDSISAVYFPLITAKPFLVVFFLPILVVVSIGLMNLVTAALVENAMANAAQQAEEERATLKEQLQHALPSLLELFHELDQDGSGMLTEEELSKVSKDVLPPRLLQTSFAEDMGDLFHYLDVDGTGSLSQSEFIEGLLNLCLLELPLSTVQSLKLLRLIRKEVRYIAECTHEMRMVMADKREIFTTVNV